jgi:hypothetical protein
MSAIRIAVTVVSAAVAASRHPVVKAGMRAVVNNPKARDTALAVTRGAAYKAGVVARRIVGQRLR